MSLCEYQEKSLFHSSSSRAATSFTSHFRLAVYVSPNEQSSDIIYKSFQTRRICKSKRAGSLRSYTTEAGHMAGFSCAFHFLFLCSSFHDGSFLADFWGKLMVNSWTLVSGCRDRFLMRTPCCILDRRWFGLRMIGMLLALSASWVFPLWLHASLPRTYNWFFSPMSASSLGLRPPAVMPDG